MATPRAALPDFPDWVPTAARHYLVHTVAGWPIRALARQVGCHPSTVLRQIRKYETLRDDVLIDAALRRLGTDLAPLTAFPSDKDADIMTSKDTRPADPTLGPDATRILRRLCERGALLAVAADMEKAVVVRDDATGSTARTAVCDRALAQALALKDWIASSQTGRIVRYHITPTGRAALEQRIGDGTHGAQPTPGMAEAPAAFEGARAGLAEKVVTDAETGRAARVRYNLSESPLAALARRRGKDGKPFLASDLVRAGERLREDFELASMGPNVTQSWEGMLTGGTRGGAPGSGLGGSGPDAARGRVTAALDVLGPGLSDVVLRTCCYLEGMESAEKKLGWSARSGKIVLRIALTQLARHYDDVHGPGGGLIG